MSIDTQSLYARLGLRTSGDAAPAKKHELGQSDFLRLMTEQLKNQDPLKPLGSTEFLGQLAQFSQVQGLQQLNSGFAGLADALESHQALQGATLVGRRVLVDGDRFHNTGTGIAGEVEATAAGIVRVDITTAAGAVVQRLSVAVDGPGRVPFAWDGRLAEGAPAPLGEYHIKATQTAGGQAQALSPQLEARVESVSLEAGHLILNLDGVGALPLSAIHRIG